jgi:CheY-specific phosphatase CheX
MHPSDFSPLIESCCADVLDSMYFTSVVDVRHELDAQVAPPAGLAFSLHFEGDVHGIFGLSLDTAAARTLAANFLGEEETTLTPEEIAEVIGELANMLCGSVVSRLEGTSKFVLTHPEPFAHAGAPPDGSPMLVSTLNTDIGPVQVWVALDPAASAPEPMEEARA